MSNRRIVCENIRSAYNVGNIIRTADAMDRGVVISGYTPSPITETKVAKSALGAEHHISLQDFGDMDWDTHSAYDRARKYRYLCVACECGQENSVSVDLWQSVISKTDTGYLCGGKDFAGLAVWVGNEVVGVEKGTLLQMDLTVSIPMYGVKSSLNVGQASAIVMWEMRK